MTFPKLFITLVALSVFVYSNAKAQSAVLQKGDSLVIQAKAIKRFTHTGIKVSRGETYQITATGRWQDAGFEPTDAGGFPPKNAAMRFAIYLKPMPKENYLKLVAKVGGRHEPIGTSAKVSFKKSGKLILQPNDAVFFFGNNSGALTVTIRRID